MYMTMTISKYTAYTNSKNYTRIVPRSSFCPISPVSAGSVCNFLIRVDKGCISGMDFSHATKASHSNTATIFFTKLKVLKTHHMNYFYDDSHLYFHTDYVI